MASGPDAAETADLFWPASELLGSGLPLGDGARLTIPIGLELPLMTRLPVHDDLLSWAESVSARDGGALSPKAAAASGAPRPSGWEGPLPVPAYCLVMVRLMASPASLQHLLSVAPSWGAPGVAHRTNYGGVPRPLPPPTPDALAPPMPQLPLQPLAALSVSGPSHSPHRLQIRDPDSRHRQRESRGSGSGGDHLPGENGSTSGGGDGSTARSVGALSSLGTLQQLEDLPRLASVSSDDITARGSVVHVSPDLTPQPDDRGTPPAHLTIAGGLPGALKRMDVLRSRSGDGSSGIGSGVISDRSGGGTEGSGSGSAPFSVASSAVRRRVPTNLNAAGHLPLHDIADLRFTSSESGDGSQHTGSSGYRASGSGGAGAVPDAPSSLRGGPTFSVSSHLHGGAGSSSATWRLPSSLDGYSILGGLHLDAPLPGSLLPTPSARSGAGTLSTNETGSGSGSGRGPGSVPSMRHSSSSSSASSTGAVAGPSQTSVITVSPWRARALTPPLTSVAPTAVAVVAAAMVEPVAPPAHAPLSPGALESSLTPPTVKPQVVTGTGSSNGPSSGNAASTAAGAPILQETEAAGAAEGSAYGADSDYAASGGHYESQGATSATREDAEANDRSEGGGEAPGPEPGGAFNMSGRATSSMGSAGTSRKTSGTSVGSSRSSKHDTTGKSTTTKGSGVTSLSRITPASAFTASATTPASGMTAVTPASAQTGGSHASGMTGATPASATTGGTGVTAGTAATVPTTATGATTGTTATNTTTGTTTDTPNTTGTGAGGGTPATHDSREGSAHADPLLPVEEDPDVAWLDVPSSPVPALPFDGRGRGDGWDLYVDAARMLPDNVLVSKVCARLVNEARAPVAPSLQAVSSLRSRVSSPSYGLAARYLPEATLAPGGGIDRIKQTLSGVPLPTVPYRPEGLVPHTTLLIRVDGMDRHSGVHGLVGYAALNLFAPPDGDSQDQPGVHVAVGDSGAVSVVVGRLPDGAPVALNAGCFQLPVFAGKVRGVKPLTVAALAAQRTRIPCCTLLVRLVHIPGGLPQQHPLHAPPSFPPVYGAGSYDSSRCRPSPGEVELYRHRADVDAASPSVRAVVDQLAALAATANTMGGEPPPVRRGGKRAQDDEVLRWITRRLDITGFTPLMSYRFLARYDPSVGVGITVDAAVALGSRGSSRVHGSMVKVVHSVFPHDGWPALAATTSAPQFTPAQLAQARGEGASFTHHHVWEAPAAVQAYRDGPVAHTGVPAVGSVLMALFEVFTVRRTWMNGFEPSPLGWGVVPLLDGHGEGYIQEGAFLVPLMEGAPTPRALAALATVRHPSECLGALLGGSQPRARLLHDGECLLVRVSDPLLEGLSLAKPPHKYALTYAPSKHPQAARYREASRGAARLADLAATSNAAPHEPSRDIHALLSAIETGPAGSVDARFVPRNTRDGAAGTERALNKAFAKALGLPLRGSDPPFEALPPGLPQLAPAPPKRAQAAAEEGGDDSDEADVDGEEADEEYSEAVLTAAPAAPRSPAPEVTASASSNASASGP